MAEARVSGTLIVPLSQGHADRGRRQVKLPANGWRPRDYQKPLWAYLENGGKRAAAVWHRRAGKDDVALHHTCCKLHERPGTYWHMLPQANQSRRAIWDAVDEETGRRRIDQAFPQELRESTRENEMFIRFKNGATWQVVGSDNFESLIGSSPVGIVFSEWAQADPRSWALLSPILDKNEGWAVFIYTPRGDNHGLSIYELAQETPGWFAEKLSAADTGVVSEETLRGIRKTNRKLYGTQSGDAYTDQEFYCSFTAAIIGAYYAEQIDEMGKDGRVCHVPYDKAKLVSTAWDLGKRDHTAIWFFQQSGREVRIIDFYINSNMELDHYAEVLRDRGYRYDEHIWPHDGNANILGMEKTRAATMRSFNVGKVRVLDRSSLEDGIHAVRRLFPRCFFDKAKTEEGRKALKSYRHEWDEERLVFKDKPLHDWSSDPADAFRYLAMGLLEPALPVKRTVAASAERRWVV